MASAAAIWKLQGFVSGQMLLLFVISVCVVLHVLHLQVFLAARREDFTRRTSLISALHVSRHSSYPVVPDSIRLMRDANRVLILILSETS